MESEFAPGPSRPAQDEQDFLPWISYIERWIRVTTESGRAASRTLSMPPSSEFVWEGYCLQSSCRAFGLTERRPAAPLLLSERFLHPHSSIPGSRVHAGKASRSSLWSGQSSSPPAKQYKRRLFTWQVLPVTRGSRVDCFHTDG